MDLLKIVRQHPLYVKYLFHMRQKVYEWFWLRHGKPLMLTAPHGVKQRAIREYARRFSLRTLVESGTYLGHMLFAMRKDFERIISVELDDALYRHAVKLFAGEKNISLFHGDSGTLMPSIVGELTEPALFWLDGHYAGAGTALAGEETPILKELEAITSSPLDHVIFIDDARLFLMEHANYPNLKNLQTYLKTKWPNCFLQMEDDIIRVQKTGGPVDGSPVTPTVLINGKPGPLFFKQGGSANVTCAVNPGSQFGQRSQWWVWLSTPDGDLWFTRKGWTPSKEPLSVGSYLLFELSPLLVWGRRRPFATQGNYFFSFIVSVYTDDGSTCTSYSYARITVNDSGQLDSKMVDAAMSHAEFENKITTMIRGGMAGT